MKRATDFEVITRAFAGCWTTAAVGAAVTLSIFSHIEDGIATVEAMSRKTGMPLRQARALLEALTGLKLLEYSSGSFRNAEAAKTYLLPSQPLYLGELVRISMELMPQWSRFTETLTSGKSLLDLRDVPDHPYWPRLVRAAAPLAIPAARFAVREVELPKDAPVSILDVGGGAGVFSAVFLQEYPLATSHQIDWRTVNEIARDYVSGWRIADRFHTIDGDFRKVDYDGAPYDLVIWAQMAHGFDPRENTVAFDKFRSVLKPNGTLLISDYIPTSALDGDAFGLLFNVNILLHTPIGLCWNEAEYRTWLAEAGFPNIRILREAGVPSLILAKVS